MNYSNLVFFVNGVKKSIPSPNPETTLLQYLRRSLFLTGTKNACEQGACGSCTVMVSYYNPDEDVIVHFCANACIMPLCYLHGMAVTTVEGIGSTKNGLHIIQQNLVDSHGLQCGFCTPGMVMAMYTLYRNNPNPTRDDLERALEGNLCRCTGYRPILDSFQKSCPCGLNLCSENKGEPFNALDSKDGVTKAKNDDTQDIIFPSELKLNTDYNRKCIAFRGDNYTWIRPTTLVDTLQLLHNYPDVTLVMGCTNIGYKIKQNLLKSPMIICGTHVRELNVLKMTDEHIEVGAAVTMGVFEKFLVEKKQAVKEAGQWSVKALLSAIRWIGSDQIRSVATIGGHVMSRAKNHDLQTLFLAMGANLVFHSKDGKSRTCVYDDDIVQNDKGTEGSRDILVSVILPLTREKEYLFFFKQPHRRGFDYAILNAGMYASVNEDGEQTEKLRVCFGNIDKRPRVLQGLDNLKIKQEWSDDSQSDLAAVLEKEFGGVNTERLHYKLTLAASFFFKFVLNLKQQQFKDLDSTSVPIAESTHGHCNSSQYYDVPTQDGNRIVWQPTPNVSGVPITTGEAIFVDDLPSYANELFLCHMGSDRAHAKVLSVDPSAALSIPGVVDYVDHGDVPGHKSYGIVIKDVKLFADGEVRCVGQPIGAILAESRELARKAAKMVKVTYEDLPAVFTIEDAVHSSSLYPFERKLVRGDTDKALEEAELTLDGAVESGGQDHFYLEPQTCVVVPRKEHKELEVTSSSQLLHELQAEISEFLCIPRNRIVTKVKRLGGAFGGKQSDSILSTGIAAVAAWKHNRPVRSVYDRDHDMRITGKRHGMKARYKVGFSRDGKISGLSVDFYLNAGYTTDVSPFVADILNIALSVPYNIPNFRAVGRLCKTNLPSCNAMRGFGGPQGSLVREHIITDIAKTLKMDPSKVREINMYKEGDTIIQHKVLEDFNLPLCIEKCKDQAGYLHAVEAIQEFNKVNSWKKRGIAMSNVMFHLGYPDIFLNQAGALVQVYLDGSVLVTHGGIEMGQGVHTKVCQVAATVLNIPLNLVHISEISIDKVPNTSESGGSIVADLNAGAVKNACMILNERLAPIKAKNSKAEWIDIIKEAYSSRISLSATGYYWPPKRTEGYDMEKNTGDFCEYFTYGAACTQVEIDCLTGEHQILKTDIVMDLGQSLNPAVDIGQIEGGFMMGCGMMTSEEITLNEKGHVDPIGPINYKVPGIKNIPREFNVTLLREVRGGGSVYSAKGVGEPPLLLGVSVHLALNEAVSAARAEQGMVDRYRLPCPATPEKIRLACADKFSKKFEKFQEKGMKVVI